MKTVFIVATSAIALGLAAPAAADHHGTAEGHSHAMAMTMSADQQADYDSWDDTQRATFDAWPDDIKGYYFTLDDTSQDAWWLLSNEQRVNLYSLEPTQRDAAWIGIMNQVNGIETVEAPATPPMRFVSNEVSQTAPAPKTEYPICKDGMTDGCINSYEANGTGNRPINYWPGKPASQIDGWLPVDKPAEAAADDDD